MGQFDQTVNVIVKATDQTQAGTASVKKSLNDLNTSASQAGGAVGQQFNVLKNAAAGVAPQINQTANALKNVNQGSGAKEATESTAKGFDKLKESGAALHSNLTALPLGIGAATAGFLGLIGALFTVGVAYQKLKSTVSEAMAEWSAQRLVNEQLKISWEAAGRAVPVAAIQSYIDALAKSTLFTDDALAGAAKILSIFPNITDELMPKALEAAVSIASATGKDLFSSAQLLGKASTGMVGALTRAGVPLSAATKQSKDFGAILDEVSTKLAGQSTLAAQTWTGQLSMMNKEWNELKESLGEALEPALLPALNLISRGVTAFADRVREAMKDEGFKSFLEEMKLLALGAAVLAKEFAKAGIEAAKLFATMSSQSGLGEGVLPPGWLDQLVGFNPALLGAKTALDAFYGKVKDMGKEASEAIEAQTDTTTKNIRTNFDDVVASITAAKPLSGAKKEESGAAGIGEEEAAFQAVAEKAENYARILQDIEKNLRNVTGTKPEIVDWDIEVKRAEAFFGQLELEAKMYYEAQKSLIAENAKSKEDAEAKIAALDTAYSMQKVSNAVMAHEQTSLLAEQRYQKEKAEIIKRNELEADQIEALKPLEAKRLEERIAAEKKLTDIIAAEITARRAELDKEFEKRQEITRQMQTEADATSKSLATLGAAGASEWDKLQLKIQQAKDTLTRAVEEMPKSPEKAIELAKSAREAFAGLQQDIAALEKNLRDTVSHFRDLEHQVAQTTMTSGEKRQDSLRQFQEMMADAQAAEQAGNLQEAEAIVKSAAAKAAALATPAEGQDPFAAQAEAAALVREAKNAAVRIAAQRLEDAKKTNEELKQRIIEAGATIAEGFGKRLEVTNQAIDRLTGALNALNATMGGRPAPVAPSGEAQQQAGTNIGGEGAQPPGGGQGTPQTAQGLPGGTPGGLGGLPGQAGETQKLLDEQNATLMQRTYEAKKTPMTAEEQAAYLTTQDYEQGGSVNSEKLAAAQKINEARLRRAYEEDLAISQEQKRNEMTGSDAEIAGQKERQAGLNERWSYSSEQMAERAKLMDPSRWQKAYGEDLGGTTGPASETKGPEGEAPQDKFLTGVTAFEAIIARQEAIVEAFAKAMETNSKITLEVPLPGGTREYNSPFVEGV